MADQVLDLDPQRIRPYAKQPRVVFNAVRMQELEDSIVAAEQQIPIIVMAIDDPAHSYEIIDGERRWRICSKLGIKVKAIVKSRLNECDQFKSAVVSNFGGEPNDALETYNAIIRFRDEFKMTGTEIAKIFGNNPAWVYTYFSFDKLLPGIRALLTSALPERERLTYSRAKVLACIAPEAQQLLVDQGALTARWKKFRSVVAPHQHGNVRTPSKEQDVVYNFANKVSEEAEVLTSKPRSYYQRVFVTLSQEKRNMIAGRLEGAIMDLQGLLHLVKETKADAA